MSINIKKGERINLAKEAPGLKKVGVALGWDANVTDTGGEFDLDASVFMLGENGKIPESIKGKIGVYPIFNSDKNL